MKPPEERENNSLNKMGGNRMDCANFAVCTEGDASVLSRDGQSGSMLRSVGDTLEPSLDSRSRVHDGLRDGYQILRHPTRPSI